MAVALSSAGIQVAYAVETTAGTKPTNFTNIPGPKSLPDFNPEPTAIQTTTLNETDYHTYIKGLKDPGGSLGITFNMNDTFQTTWDAIVTAFTTAKSSNKAMWIEFVFPGMAKGFFFTAEPGALGSPAAAVDGVLEVTVSLMPTGNIGWGTKVAPT